MGYNHLRRQRQYSVPLLFRSQNATSANADYPHISGCLSDLPSSHYMLWSLSCTCWFSSRNHCALLRSTLQNLSPTPRLSFDTYLCCAALRKVMFSILSKHLESQNIFFSLLSPNIEPTYVHTWHDNFNEYIFRWKMIK